MKPVIVDSNVLLDVLTDDPVWADWSQNALATCSASGELWINPIIYAEVSLGFTRIEDLDAALAPDLFHRRDLPYAAGFLAGKAFVRYRRSGGGRRTPLPDFYIGAHAAIERAILLTRDPEVYRTYYPQLEVRAPA